MYIKDSRALSREDIGFLMKNFSKWPHCTTVLTTCGPTRNLDGSSCPTVFVSLWSAQEAACRKGGGLASRFRGFGLQQQIPSRSQKALILTVCQPQTKGRGSASIDYPTSIFQGVYRSNLRPWHCPPPLAWRYGVLRTGSITVVTVHL